MADVVFNEEPQLTPIARAAIARPKGATGLLVKIGIVRSEKEASIALAGAAAAILVLAAFLYIRANPGPHVPTPAELKETEDMVRNGIKK